MKSLDDIAGDGYSDFGPVGPATGTECLRMRAFVRRIPSAVGHVTLKDGSQWECRNVDGFVQWIAVGDRE